MINLRFSIPINYESTPKIETQYITPNPAKIQLKQIDKEKEREADILDNNLDNLFMKEEVILEYIQDEPVNVLDFSMLKGNKEKFTGVPLPAKNNFLDIDFNKYNKEVLKMKDDSKTTGKRSSFETNSPQTSIIKQNKSYNIEKEDFQMKESEKKNYSTIFIEKDEKMESEKNNKMMKTEENIIINKNEKKEKFEIFNKTRDPDFFKNNKDFNLTINATKSNENIFEKDLDKSFKTVKSENDEDIKSVSFHRG